MLASTPTKNMALLEALDAENISLENYISLIIDKELLKQGLIKGENINDVLKELND